MNILSLLRNRFAAAMADMSGDLAPLLDMVRPSQDPRFGDYQANCAMPLAKQLGRSPREVADQIVRRLDVTDICDAPEIAGPGFINLRLADDWLTWQCRLALDDAERLGVARVEQPRTFVLDYSSPNVAKPMHVGHIRSTVIGDSLYRLLSFLGHRTISDNHVGDWGTQFGMILYGYKNFVDEASYGRAPLEELSRLYRLVNRLVEYHVARLVKIPDVQRRIENEKEQLGRFIDDEQNAQDKAERKKLGKIRRQAEARLGEMQSELSRLTTLVERVDDDPELARLAEEHQHIDRAVLAETAKLHAGDQENRRLWSDFLPPCMEEIEKVYRRLGVSFDHTLGESFYQDRLADVVRELREAGLAVESDGAMCVFVEGQPAPMIVQKQDGAFLYATTDLATLRYRMSTFHPDAMLYVVDHRQSLHFEQLFAVARKWGYDGVQLEHVSFGTVLGEDGRPFRTRSGDVVGLSHLLDEAVRRAEEIVTANDQAKPEPELSPEQRKEVAEAVGIGALKYADLAHNRTSDYVFSYDKMLAMKGNTAAYMQYSYARVRSIFARGGVALDVPGIVDLALSIEHPAERALVLELLRLSEALDRAASDLRPNHLTSYLFDVATRFSEFFEQCPVLKAPTDPLRTSRLLLCEMTGRTLRKGLELLGIETVEKM